MSHLHPGREIAFFLPAHNEAENLPYVVQRATEYLRDNATTYEIIIVDDGSVDKTPEVAIILSQQFPNVRVINHPVNLGYGAALRTGLAESLRSRMSWIAFCDSDGQFDPADVDKLLAAAEDHGADSVLGYRISRADGLKRRLMGRAWHSLSSRIVGFQARDVDCGFKLFRNEAIEAICPQLRGEHATISPEILIRLQLGGFRIVEVGVPHAPRLVGEQSGASLHVIWTSLLGLLHLRRSLRKEARYADTRVVASQLSSTDPARF